MRTVALLAVAALLAMILPHLPGRFDASAATLSFVAQIGSYASVVFTPLAIGWLLPRGPSRLVVLLSTLAGSVTLTAVVVAAAAVNHLALGALLAALGIPLLQRLHSDSTSALEGARRHRVRIAIAQVAVPFLLASFAIVALPRAATWSRDRAILHSAALIEAIEAFRQRRGHYPPSLLSLNSDVPTGVVGVERFQYEPSDSSYNVFFIRPSVSLDASEVVLYNPRGLHRFTSHELDLLQYDGTDLDRRRGDRRRTPLRQSGWISILFD